MLETFVRAYACHCMQQPAVKRRFDQAKRLAEQRAHDPRQTLASVLSRHAVVLVEAVALRGAADRHFLGLGMRLERVQHDWVGLLCGGLIGDDSQLDSSYRGTVARIVYEFTERLRAMLVESDAGAGIITDQQLEDTYTQMTRFHSQLTRADQMAMRSTRGLFQQYVRSLAALCGTDGAEYCNRGIECLEAAQTLGEWLDRTVFAAGSR